MYIFRKYLHMELDIAVHLETHSGSWYHIVQIHSCWSWRRVSISRYQHKEVRMRVRDMILYWAYDMHIYDDIHTHQSKRLPITGHLFSIRADEIILFGTTRCRCTILFSSTERKFTIVCRNSVQCLAIGTCFYICRTRILRMCSGWEENGPQYSRE